MDISVQRRSFGAEDQSWLGSAHGTNAAQSITLDVSTFTKADHFPLGFLKSGLPLQKLSGGDFGLWESGKDLAGFLFTSTRVSDSAEKVGAALFEHGRVKVAKLPVPVDAAGQETAAGRLIFA